MLRSKAALVGLYFATLVCVCGITIVGPAIGGSITNISLTPPDTSVGCDKNLDLSSLPAGNSILYANLGMSNWVYAVALWTDGNSLVKLLVNGESINAGADVTVPFSFEASGFADPTGILFGIEGTSSNTTGLVGLFPIIGPTAADANKNCTMYEICLAFGDGDISLGPTLFPYSGGGSFLVNGELYLYNANTGGNFASVYIGPNSADIQLTDSAVPEPSSVLLLAGGLGVLAWLRRRIGQFS